MKEDLILYEPDGYGLVRVTFGFEGSQEDTLLVLDTGAARTTLSTRISSALRLPFKEKGRIVAIQGVSGPSVGVLFPLDVSILDATLRGHEVQFTSFPSFRVGIGPDSHVCEGLLGNDLLRAARLRTVIDVPKNRAVLATHDLR